MKKVLLALSLLTLSTASMAVDFATEGKKYEDLAGTSVNAVHILSKSLQTQNKTLFGGHQSVLSVEFLNSQRTQVGTLEVSAYLRNRSSTPAQIEARTLFLGNGGMPIGDESAWQRLYLDANGTATYKEVSLKTQQVKHYRIEIREAN